MKEFIAISLAVSGISFTVTFTSIFSWLRELVSSLHPKLEELIHCPWCFSHWVTFPLVFLIDFRLAVSSPIIDYFLTAFAIIGASGLAHYVFLRAYKPVHENMMMREMEKRQESR